MILCILLTQKKNLKNSIVLEERRGESLVLGYLKEVSNDFSTDGNRTSMYQEVKSGGSVEIYAKEVFTNTKGLYIKADNGATQYLTDDESKDAELYVNYYKKYIKGA